MVSRSGSAARRFQGRLERARRSCCPFAVPSAQTMTAPALVELCITQFTQLKVPTSSLRMLCIALVDQADWQSAKKPEPIIRPVESLEA